MNDQIREQLIGYVLGALDECEQRHVESQLRNDPFWRQELEAVQRCLEPLAETCEEHEPPADLAERACRFVAQESDRLRVTRPAKVSPAREGGFDVRDGWRIADWVVMAGVCLVAVALFFPALLQSRNASRVTYCANNLRSVGIMLAQFSEATRERLFPGASVEGNRAFAGIYGPVLRDSALLNDSRLIVCPDSPLAEELAGFEIPSLAAIDAAVGDEVFLLQRIGGGTYAYSLGYILNGMYSPPRNLGRAYFVVMADSPSLDLGRLAPHGDGFNVLFEDGHVQFLKDFPKRQLLADHPFFNRMGRTEAGTDVDDAVVAHSSCPPLSRRLNQPGL